LRHHARPAVPGWHGGGDIHGGDSKASIDRLTCRLRDRARQREAGACV